MEGNPLDRTILTGALLLATIVLIRRGRRVFEVLRENLPILCYFFYCGLSSIWSDFPDVSFKRWFRAVGDLIMVLIVLTDPNWYQALKRLLTRVGFLVIPLSALFIRYFPELGRAYSRGGQPSWTGVGTDKNALGIICAVFGLAAVYFFVELYHQQSDRATFRRKIAYGIVIPLAFYLLWQSNSATAFACSALGGAVLVLTRIFAWARKPAFLHLSVSLALLVPFSAMFLGIGSGLVENLGRNATFTGRTAIWHNALSMVRNPLVGEGFESFWLGHRLTDMENAIHQGVNQAHNGYIEVYLNLGWIGLTFLAVLLISAYRRATAAARDQTPAGSLRLAYFVVAVTYNFSEGGFKMMHPAWIGLLVALAIPTAPDSRPNDAQITLDDSSVSFSRARLRGSNRDVDHHDKVRVGSVRSRARHETKI